MAKETEAGFTGNGEKQVELAGDEPAFSPAGNGNLTKPNFIESGFRGFKGVSLPKEVWPS
ncbi:MAG: hypothetical protein PHZ04_03010 [Patescibacteria group bacterium]|nr:hypothetical protein [Patescibacteria group bacterium]MDD5294379.1 hypothetical protein [Patescibacteria group bacterium]MDD5554674.1 hypothetical protein [Patescibacteria group bacterium]